MAQPNNGQEAFAEFQQRIAHLALTVPEERLQPLFIEYVELRRLIGVLERETVTSEPANTFSVLAGATGEAS